MLLNFFKLLKALKERMCIKVGCFLEDNCENVVKAEGIKGLFSFLGLRFEQDLKFFKFSVQFFQTISSKYKFCQFNDNNFELVRNRHRGKTYSCLRVFTYNCICRSSEICVRLFDVKSRIPR